MRFKKKKKPSQKDILNQILKLLLSLQKVSLKKEGKNKEEKKCPHSKSLNTRV